MNEDILAKILKLVEYEIVCQKHYYKGCENCPLDGNPYCELGKIRVELQDYFSEHKEELREVPEQVRFLIYSHDNTLRNRIYDEISRVLTEYEEGLANAEDLYNVLVTIQNNWEYLFSKIIGSTHISDI